MRYGAAKLERAGRPLQFVTLTLGRPPDGIHESDAEMLDRLMRGWRKLVHGRWWRGNMAGAEYFRVVEARSVHGRPHIHLMVAAELPYVRAPKGGESLFSWRADLSTDGAGMVAALEAAGMGPICHVERLRGGGAGAATYLGGYLSKSEKQLKRPDGPGGRGFEGVAGGRFGQNDLSGGGRQRGARRFTL